MGELEPIIARELAQINELMITRKLTREEQAKREREIERRVERARQTREEFDQARYELVNDKGFREEFMDTVKRSRITPHESLLFTYSFLKKENGCWCKLLSSRNSLSTCRLGSDADFVVSLATRSRTKSGSSSAARIHVTRDICERVSEYLNKRENRGIPGEELESLVKAGGELEIDFDGDSAYLHRERTFFKPAGAFIHFLINYLRASFEDSLEDSLDQIFYGTLKEPLFEGMKPGRYWVFVYDMVFKGFFETKSYEYFLANESGTGVMCLEDEEKKLLWQRISLGRVPKRIALEGFEDLQRTVEDRVEERKEDYAAQAMGKNGLKINSRIQAIQTLSDVRVRGMVIELLGKRGREEEKIKRAIKREKEKVRAKIKILEEKKKYVGTYALDAVCLLDVMGGRERE